MRNNLRIEIKSTIDFTPVYQKNLHFVFPADAGMNRNWNSGTSGIRSVPRKRGVNCNFVMRKARLLRPFGGGED